MNQPVRHAVPAYCKGCTHLHTGGVKDGQHDRWCCHHGKPAPKAWKGCKEHGGKAIKEPQ